MTETEFTTFVAAILLAGGIDADHNIPDTDIETAVETAHKLIKAVKEAKQ